jgi:hypothetical protein
MKTKPKFKVGDLVDTEYGLAVITKPEWVPPSKSNCFDSATDKPVGFWYYHFTVSEGNNLGDKLGLGGFSPWFRTGAKCGDLEELIDLHDPQPEKRATLEQMFMSNNSRIPAEQFAV